MNFPQMFFLSPFFVGLPSINPDFNIFKILIGFLQMSTGGAFLRRELQDVSYLEYHLDICQMFKDAGCYRFCEKLQGYHQGIAEAFAKSFDGAKVKLGPLEMKIDEASVAATNEMPGEGERWFKTTAIKDIEFRSYLKPNSRALFGKRMFPGITWKTNGRNC
jgi:hypothetical protein